MADGASLADWTLRSLSGFDHPWDVSVGVYEPAPRKEQCTVRAEPGLGLGGCEAPGGLARQMMPPDLEAIHQTKKVRGWRGVPALSPPQAGLSRLG